MNELKLANINEYTKVLSLKYFDKPYQSKVSFNNRLKKAAGRCFTNSGRIELATTYAKHVSEETLKKVILHELVHYHLDKLGYTEEGHGDKFKTLAKKVGAFRFAPAIDIKYYNHVEVTCLDCGNHFSEFRAFDTSRYRCGHCDGRLVLKHVKAVK